MEKFRAESYTDRRVTVDGNTLNDLASLIAMYMPAAQCSVADIMSRRDFEIDKLDDEFGFERRP